MVWIIGVPVIGFLIWRVVQRVRAIAALDARLREEEARQAQNPYADMARMYEVQQMLEEAKGKKKQR